MQVHSAPVHTERWAIALSSCVALGMALSLLPPGGAPARGLRVESLGPIVQGRPTLLRVSIEDAATRSWRAPSQARATLTLQSPHHSQTIDQSTQGRGAWLLMQVPPAEGAEVGAREHFAVEAEGYSTAFEATLAAPPSATVERAESALLRPGEYSVRIEGGVLTPEVPSVMVVTGGVSQAGNLLQIQATDPSFLLSPERVTLDTCGTAVLYARPAGLSAAMTLTANGETKQIALTLAPGALVSKLEDTYATIAHALGGITAYVIMGDDRGPTEWRSMPLETASDRAVQARVVLPSPIRWFATSASPEFDHLSGAWREPLPVQPGGTLRNPVLCTETETGRLLARISRELPTLPSFVLRADGAQNALGSRDVRRQRWQTMALTLSVVGLVALSVLMLFAVYRARRVDASIAAQNSSYGVVIKSAVALLAMGVALLLLVQLRRG